MKATWLQTQLTFGSREGQFHSHSYYDIPVFDAAGARIVAYRTSFSGRHPDPGDTVEVGIVDRGAPGSWQPLGTTSAWSWQQGPMAQWVPGQDAVIWNTRTPQGFAAEFRHMDGRVRKLNRSVYALSPNGHFGLGVSMARLDQLRPGYGYATDKTAVLDPVPRDDGIWTIPLDGTRPRLIVPLDEAVRFLQTQLGPLERLSHRWRKYHYWFNHVKIAPGGGRFTVKLRWRNPDGPWHGGMGVSLTCGIDGEDLAMLEKATSHVLWQDDRHLYFYDEKRRRLSLYADGSPRGTPVGVIGNGVIDGNVHLRHLPPGKNSAPGSYVFDTPYREAVSLLMLDAETGTAAAIAQFEGHRPAKGPFRCDLHPTPDAAGRRIVVCSLQDGGRQLYLLERD